MSIEKLNTIADTLRKQNAYIISSIDGEGVYIGRFKGFSCDADGDLVIEADIDGISCTG